MNERRFCLVPANVEALALSLPKRPGMRLQAIHEYTRADGSPWWWIARWKHPETGEKLPIPFHRGPDGAFVRKIPEIPHGARPLYRLHKIGQYPSEVVWVVEGEACADLLESLGFIATTWPNGSQAVPATDWSPLASRLVVLWPDNDGPGFEAMDAVRRILRALGARVGTLEVTAINLPPKGDAVDWLRSFVSRFGCRKIHEVPDGHSIAWHEIDAFPLIEEMAVAA